MRIHDDVMATGVGYVSADPTLVEPSLELRSAGSAVTIGKFDGVHRGHQRLLARLSQAAARRDLTSVAVTIDLHGAANLRGAALRPGGALGGRLTTGAQQRQLLERFGVDRVVSLQFTEAFANLSPWDFAERFLAECLHARVVIVGPDFRFGSGRAGSVDDLVHFGRYLGFDVEIIDPVELGGERVSSTHIRELVGRGDLRGASALLGWPYDRGTVLGRPIGTRPGGGLLAWLERTRRLLVAEADDELFGRP